ncbi:hypothetical protein HPP92_014268 [Vanilla planifolia]|uniref:Uncharacterized protein n=1 Tax=Vanilla planifolia TaxID=51239 RepID=A0A835UX96_VANPL|nr:hypothetical protein HPP92_014268 [Vanilla planifolia]
MRNRLALGVEKPLAEASSSFLQRTKLSLLRVFLLAEAMCGGDTSALPNEGKSYRGDKRAGWYINREERQGKSGSFGAEINGRWAQILKHNNSGGKPGAV